MHPIIKKYWDEFKDIDLYSAYEKEKSGKLKKNITFYEFFNFVLDEIIYKEDKAKFIKQFAITF